MQRPNGNGHNQGHAAGVGGALGMIVVAVLANGFKWTIDPLTSSAIVIVMAYAAAWLPKPPNG